jgi:hypothetical protein
MLSLSYQIPQARISGCSRERFATLPFEVLLPALGVTIMMFARVSALFALLSVLGVGAQASAIPSAVTYTAWLQDPDGKPASTAPTKVQIDLWSAASGGVMVKSTPGAMSFDAGYLQVTLEGIDAGALPAGLWAEVTIDGETFQPRQRIVSVPYALQAGNVTLPVGPTAPTATSSGELWYDTSTGALRVFDGATWLPAVDAYTKAASDAALSTALTPIADKLGAQESITAQLPETHMAYFRAGAALARCLGSDGNNTSDAVSLLAGENGDQACAASGLGGAGGAACIEVVQAYPPNADSMAELAAGTAVRVRAAMGTDWDCTSFKATADDAINGRAWACCAR